MQWESGPGAVSELQVDNIHSLIPLVGHLGIEGHQVGQAGPALHKPTLSVPDPVLSCASCDSTQDSSSKIRMTGL